LKNHAQSNGTDGNATAQNRQPNKNKIIEEGFRA
jgi:hypothetical protein